MMVPSADPGIEIFVRNKRPAAMTAFRPERTVLFVHGGLGDLLIADAERAGAVEQQLQPDAPVAEIRKRDDDVAADAEHLFEHPTRPARRP